MTADVVVVGAGPAGSSVALRLSRAGIGVVLLERKRFPRDKVCGEYLSPAALAALSELGVGRRVASLGHPIRRVALAAFGSGPVTMALPAGGALALSRADLDSILRDAAIAAGAEPLDGIFRDLRDEGAGWRVSYRDGSGVERHCTARAVVGADGAWSNVARSAGLAGDARRAGRWAVGGHVRSHEANSDTLEMFVGAGGYYARNPLGGEHCNSMLVMPKPVADDARADAIVDEVTAGRYRFEGASLIKRVAVGPLRYAPHSVAAPGVTLTGDAAGMLDPFVGQGVAVALESSVTCAAGVMAHLAGAPTRETVSAIAAARRRIERPRRMLAAVVDFIVRTPPLRALALRRARRDIAAAEMVLAAVAGAVPSAQTMSPAALVRLLA